MKIAVGLAALTLGACFTSAQADTAQDFDLSCAVVATAKMGTARRNGEDWHTLFAVFNFYLGRLTARDSNPHWCTIIMGRVAEINGQPVPDQMASACLDFVDHFIAPLK